MSIEEILEMKEKIGSKLFNQGLGIGNNKTSKRSEKYKRENKNRPRMEPISKKPVRRPKDVVGVKSENKKDVRDPRFDPLCGDFDDKVWIAFLFHDSSYDLSDSDFQRLLQVCG